MIELLNNVLANEAQGKISSVKLFMATVKIVGLLIKTISKPIAKSLKSSATNHPFFKRICISVAQKTHSFEHSLKLRFLDYNSEAITHPLSEARAIQKGADFISEFFLFIVAGTVVAAETIRGRLSSQAKSDELDTQLSTLQSEIKICKEKLQQVVVDQETLQDSLKKLQDTLNDYQTKK